MFEGSFDGPRESPTSVISHSSFPDLLSIPEIPKVPGSPSLTEL